MTSVMPSVQQRDRRFTPLKASSFTGAKNEISFYIILYFLKLDILGPFLFFGKSSCLLQSWFSLSQNVQTS